MFAHKQQFFNTPLTSWNSAETYTETIFHFASWLLSVQSPRNVTEAAQHEVEAPWPFQIESPRLALRPSGRSSQASLPLVYLRQGGQIGFASLSTPEKRADCQKTSHSGLRSPPHCFVIAVLFTQVGGGETAAPCTCGWCPVLVRARFGFASGSFPCRLPNCRSSRKLERPMRSSITRRSDEERTAWWCCH